MRRSGPRGAAALALATALSAVAMGATDATIANEPPDWTFEPGVAATAIAAVGGTPLLAVAVGADGTVWQRAPDDDWAAVPGLPSMTKARVAGDPSDASVVYVAGVNGVARTVDTGASWTLVLPTERAARIDVGPSGHVAVGERRANGTNHVLVSADRGATWTNANAPLPDGEPICGVAFGRTAMELLTMTDERSWYTHDGGATWTETPGAALDLGIEDDGTVWRLELARLERTTDGGETWDAVALPSVGTALAPHPAGGLYVATVDGLLVTRDGGASWQDLGAADAMRDTTLLSADPFEAERVLLAHRHVGVARVAGGTLSGDARGLPLAPVGSVAASPDGAFAVAVGPDGTFLRRGADADWAHAGGALALRAPGVAAISADGATVLVGGKNVFGSPVVEVSQDGGSSFFRVTLLGGRAGEVTGLSFDPDDNQRALATVTDFRGIGYVVETRSGGERWFDALVLPGGFQDVAWTGDAAYVATASGLLARLDGGGWLPIGPPGLATALAPDGAGLAAAGSAGTLWRAPMGPAPLVPWAVLPIDATALALHDGGTAWAATVDGGLVRCAWALPGGPCAGGQGPGAGVEDLAFAGSTLLAATDGGLARATPTAAGP